MRDWLFVGLTTHNCTGAVGVLEPQLKCQQCSQPSQSGYLCYITILLCSKGLHVVIFNFWLGLKQDEFDGVQASQSLINLFLFKLSHHFRFCSQLCDKM